ncbi:hypothetical protein [Lutibacter sp.]|uniref:hypothetical protein n=1 Tax=Lutibacter sp. TaxID=1925666 RepID=UPI0025B8E07A|nr:hypothetical protein [Lutibacter sp.]MCF6181981.1 carboxypeptidase-like regulatory domain-containing protein [Lutibacter sp.]
MKTINVFLLFLFVVLNCYTQQHQKTITGKLLNYQKPINDVAVLNLNTKTGTISNDNGKFTIMVKLNDTLLITSIQYQTRKMVITKKIVDSFKPIIIQLIPSVTILEEVFVHRKITGDLVLDSKNTPKDKTPKPNFTITKAEISGFSLKYSTSNYTKPPNAEAFTNPIQMYGVGGGASIPDERYEKYLKSKKLIHQKKDFPTKIVTTLGLPFFINELKIPKEKINNFLTYCEYKNIIEKYYNHQLLEVIKILQDESKSYHEIKN